MSSKNEPLKADFRNFLYIIWKHLNLPDPTPRQYSIALFLANQEHRRKIIMGFRGVGKSWITSAFVLWRLYRDPQTKILVVSASKERADAFSTFTRRLINEVAILRHLVAKDGQRDSNVTFDVGPAVAAHAPSVKSVGITGQLTGSRANLIVADDVETPENAYTQLQRDRLSEAVKEFDAVLNPGGEVVYLGTPQCEMSLYNLLRDRGYVARIWPSRYPSEKEVLGYRGALCPEMTKELLENPALVGTPTDPIRFSDLDLIERAASYGASGYALQFQLNTSLSDAERYPLKLSDLIVLPLDTTKGPVTVTWGRGPEHEIREFSGIGFAGDRCYRPMFIDKEYANYEAALMSIDPSGRGADETTYAVTKLLQGRVCLMEVGGFRSGYDEPVLQALADAAKRHGVGRIEIESNFGDGMFTALLKPYLSRTHPCMVEEVRHSTQKERRIVDTLEPVLNQHRLLVNFSLLEEDLKVPDVNYRLTYQMTRITRDKGALIHDDRLDAVAMGVAYWIERLKVSTEDANRQYREQLLDEELAKFIGHSMGGPRETVGTRSSIVHRTHTRSGPGWVDTGFA